MNIWITTDPHLGHSKMTQLCGRPKDYESRYLKGISMIPKKDVHICLGDVAWHDEGYWHEQIMYHTECRNWLVLGNHDSRSIIFFR